jgi:hypothetical protein
LLLLLSLLSVQPLPPLVLLVQPPPPLLLLLSLLFIRLPSFVLIRSHLGWRQGLHDMKDNLKIKEKEKKGVGADLAACHPVPRSCSSPFMPVVLCTAVWDGVDAYMI